MQNLKPIKKGEVRNPKGRPKNILKQLEEITGEKFDVKISKDDKLRILEWLSECSINQLVEIAKDKDQPILASAYATAMLRDLKRGNTFGIEAVMDRVVGKPRQTIEQKGDMIVNFTQLDENI